MKRGEIWTVAGGGEYTGKPRPAVIIQDDAFGATASVTICVFTTDPIEAPFFRIPIEPDEPNGLREPSRLMVDKVTTVRREKLGSKIGTLSEADTIRLNQAIVVFLGITRTVRSSAESASQPPPPA